MSCSSSDLFACNERIGKKAFVNVKVLYFASLKDKLGKETEEFEVEDGMTLKSLINQIKTKNNSIAKLLEGHSFLFAVNQEIANLETVLKSDDEIAVLPPLSGG